MTMLKILSDRLQFFIHEHMHKLYTIYKLHIRRYVYGLSGITTKNIANFSNSQQGSKRTISYTHTHIISYLCNP